MVVDSCTVSRRVARDLGIGESQFALVQDSAAVRRVPTVDPPRNAPLKCQILDSEVARRQDGEQPEIGGGSVPFDRDPIGAGRTDDRDLRRNVERSRSKFAVIQSGIEHREADRGGATGRQDRVELNHVGPVAGGRTVHRRVRFRGLNRLAQRDLPIQRRVVGQGGHDDGRKQRTVWLGRDR